jgi:hypothetical protein
MRRIQVIQMLFFVGNDEPSAGGVERLNNDTAVAVSFIS